MHSDRVTATRHINATAADIFAVVADPAGHIRIDGSGMLRTSSSTSRLTKIGETFDVEMDRRPLGDIPDLTYYTVRNIVTNIIPDRLLEWSVVAIGHPPVGYIYGWQINPVTDTECEVSNYCDWSTVGDEFRSGETWPVVPLHMLEKSVANLERIVTTR